MTALVSKSGDTITSPVEREHASTNNTLPYVQSLLPAGEKIGFQERGVALTERYALLNFKLYMLRDIHGSSLHEQSRDRSVVLTIVVLGSILAALIAVVSFSGSMITLAASGVLALALRLAVPSTHILRIVTAEGEHDALLARDRAYLLRVFEALNAALSRAHT